MKKLYFLFVVVLFFVSGKAQIINFPDANFKAKLLQPGGFYDHYLEQSFVLDANSDGEIEVNEVNFLLNIDISNANISDLTGISNFTSLISLNCSNNVLQNIIIGSTNASLKELVCTNNLLQSLSVDPAVRLKRLIASSNQLSTVNVHYDHAFSDIFEWDVVVQLSYNNITSFACEEDYNWLYLSGNPLTTFDLNGAVITNLDLTYTPLSSITGAGRLKFANFQNCQFTELDLTNVSFYWPNGGSKIYLGNNPIDKVIFGASSPANLTYSSTNSSFDLTNFGGYNNCRYHWQEEEGGNVRIIDCPNLNFLSMKNGVNHRNITCTETTSGETWTQSTLRLAITNCPSLSFICVDEGEQDHIQEKINVLGLQNQVQVNSYCSFTPGGTFYTINGNTKLDENNNGCDGADAVIPNFKFSIMNGTNTGEIISNDSGNYFIPVTSGTQTITPSFENPSYFNVSPSNVSVTFPGGTSPFGQNFCVTPNGVHNDLEIAIVPVDAARPGFNSTYKIIYKNKGNQTQSGTISLAFNDAVLDFVNANPAAASQVSDALNWDYVNLTPLESREISLTTNTNSPMEIPPVNGGDILNFTASVNSSLTDETPGDNTFALNQTVVNSFDPNDKTCLEGNTITPEMVGKDVHYLIRFENTGTANAENVVVKDMIDMEKFDINSLIPIDGSHSFVTRISNTNKVEFIFENINLPFDDANNDGYVAFKIKTKPTLVVGDSFSNTASIYFDYNFPIITNTATTTLALLAKSDFAFENYFSIYPNPANNVLNIEAKKTIDVTSISIYNTLGQVVLVIPNAQQTKSVDVSSLKTGNYLMKVNSDQGSSSVKFVKL
jgi:uncharacterized repeat protein (TIGR01451 family)